VIQKGDKKIIRGWVMYDWANSVYNLVISSSIFPIFYETQTRMVYAENNGLNANDVNPNSVTVDFLGMHVSPSVLYSLTLSLSFVIVTFLSPLLSGIADYTGSKKKFLRFFCYLGSISAMSLYFFDAHRIELGLISVLLASIGYWNSLVFYNAFLPEIAEPKDQDKVSARGFIMGYLGSMLLLLICLGIIMGIDKSYTRISFLLVGLWWVGFSQYTYRVLPNNVYNKTPQPGYIWRGFRELKVVFQEFRKTNRLKKYLRSFFFFNTGVQTVMLMATVFAAKAIEWPGESGKSGLIIAVLLIQLLGAIGAKIMSSLAVKLDNIKALMISVGIWIVICCCAFFIHKPTEFYFLAASVGLVMGGVQAVARSTYSKYLPETTDHASYFSFYDATEKIGIVFGTAFFALTEYLFEDIRYSIFSVGAFFVMGFIFLFFVPKEENSNLHLEKH
jgi:UMF1 family MFS transporter